MIYTDLALLLKAIDVKCISNWQNVMPGSRSWKPSATG